MEIDRHLLGIVILTGPYQTKNMVLPSCSLFGLVLDCFGSVKWG